MVWPTSLGVGLLFALVWLLNGCVSQPPATSNAPDFRMEGKIGVVEAGQAYSAHFAWAQRGKRFDIELRGPLGQGRTRLSGDGGCLQIIDPRGEVLARGQPEALMREHLGWSLPLNLLLNWLHGRPAASPPASAQVSGVDGRLTGFDQFGWRVRFAGFQPHQGRLAPSRITAEKLRSRVRVVVAKRI